MNNKELKKDEVLDLLIEFSDQKQDAIEGKELTQITLSYDAALNASQQIELLAQTPAALPVVDNRIISFIKEVLVEVEWMFDNMGTPHTSDHFNRPANLVQQLKDALEQWQTISPVTPVRSAEEVFKKHYKDNFGLISEENVVAAMEEYANQFKGTTPAIHHPIISASVWVMTKEKLIEIFKAVSLLDLSDCTFDFGDEDFDNKNCWCNAELNGKVIDAIQYNGNIFMMTDNGGDFHPLNPMKPAFDIFYKSQSLQVKAPAVQDKPNE